MGKPTGEEYDRAKWAAWRHSKAEAKVRVDEARERYDLAHAVVTLLEYMSGYPAERESVARTQMELAWDALVAAIHESWP